MTGSDTSFVQIIVLFFWWIFASAAVAGAADKRGYGQGIWFLMSFFFSPIFAAILLVAHPVKVISERAKDDRGDGLSITSEG